MTVYPPRGHSLAAAALAASTFVAACTAARPEMSGPGYRYFVAGNPADVAKPTRGLWVAQGGGDDVDRNYVRMGEFGGGGDFVVLRASGADEYNDYIFGLCNCDSVETLVFDRGTAMSDPFVIEKIRNAEALFIAGGDQSNYIRYWKDTPVEDAINFVAAKPAPIGGTSAGIIAAVQAHMRSGATPARCARRNAASAVTFIGTMNGVITPVAIIFAPSGRAAINGTARKS